MEIVDGSHLDSVQESDKPNKQDDVEKMPEKERQEQELEKAMKNVKEVLKSSDKAKPVIDVFDKLMETMVN